jgi:hypothetical protein
MAKATAIDDDNNGKICFDVENPGYVAARNLWYGYIAETNRYKLVIRTDRFGKDARFMYVDIHQHGSTGFYNS